MPAFVFVDMNKWKRMKVSIMFLALLVAVNSMAADWNETIVGDEKIKVPLGHFEVEISNAPPDAQRNLLQNPDKLKDMLGQMYLSRVLAAEAVDRGLDRDPLLQAAVESYRLDLLSKARLKQIRQEPVPDMSAAAREYYRAHPEEFMSQERADVSHILIQWKGKNRSREEARQLATELLEKVRAGEDITKLADAHSDDPSVKNNHGRLGWMVRDKLDKAFANQVFSLDKGETGLVETRFGYHVVKLWNKEPKHLLAFEQVKDRIVARLEADYRRDRVRSYIDELKQRPITIDQKVLDAYLKEKLPQLGVENSDAEARKAVRDD